MTTSHPSQKRGTSQAMLILGRLAATPGEWVGLPELHALSRSMAVHSRINDLRNLGYQIAHRNERPKNSTAIHSFYRLVTDPVAAPESLTSKSKSKSES